MQSVSLFPSKHSSSAQTRNAFEDYLLLGVLLMLLHGIIDIFRMIGNSVTDLCGFILELLASIFLKAGSSQ